MDGRVIRVELQLAEKLPSSFKPSSVHYGLVLHVRRSELNGTREVASFHPFLTDDVTPNPIHGVVRDQARVEQERGVVGSALDKRLVRPTPFEIDLKQIDESLPDKLQRVLLLLRPIGPSIQTTQGLRLVLDRHREIDCSGSGPDLVVLHCEEEFEDDDATLKLPYDGNIDAFARAIESASNAYVNRKTALSPVQTTAGASPGEPPEPGLPTGSTPPTEVAANGGLPTSTSQGSRQSGPESSPQTSTSQVSRQSGPESSPQTSPNRPPSNPAQRRTPGKNVELEALRRSVFIWRFVALGAFGALVLFGGYLAFSIGGGEDALLIARLRQELVDKKKLHEQAIEAERKAKEVALAKKDRDLAQSNQTIADKNVEIATLTASRDDARADVEERVRKAVEAGDEKLAEERRSHQAAIADLLKGQNAQAAQAKQELKTTRGELVDAPSRLQTCEEKPDSPCVGERVSNSSRPEEPRETRREMPQEPPRESVPASRVVALPTLSGQQQAMLREMLGAANKLDFAGYKAARQKISSSVKWQPSIPALRLPNAEQQIRDAYRNNDQTLLATPEKDLSAFVAEQKNYWNGHALLALVHAGLGRNEAAMRHAQQALVLNPDSDNALLALGIAATKTGNFPEADGAFCALAMVGSSPLVTDFLDNLDRTDTLFHSERVNSRAVSAKQRCDLSGSRGRLR